MRLEALRVEVAPVGAGSELWRLKALNSNLDLKVSRDAPGGAKRGHLTVLRRVWRLKALESRSHTSVL